MILLITAVVAGIGVLTGTVLLSKSVAPTLDPGPDVRSEARAIMRRSSQVCSSLEAIALIAGVILAVAFLSLSQTAIGEPQRSPDLWMQISAVVSGVVTLSSISASITIRVGARRRAEWLLPPTEAIPSGHHPPLTFSLLLVGVTYGVLAAFALPGNGKTMFAVVILAVLLAATRALAVVLDWGLFAVRSAWHALLRSVAAGNDRAVQTATVAHNFERRFNSKKGRKGKGPVSESAVRRLTTLTMPAAPTRPAYGALATLAFSVVLTVPLVAWQVRRLELSEVIAYNSASAGADLAAEAWSHAVQVLIMAIVLAVMLYGFRLVIGGFATTTRQSLRRMRSAT